jgi:hypothetical protein
MMAIAICALISTSRPVRSSGMNGISPHSVMITRAVVMARMPILRRCRTRSISTVAGSCAMIGIAASRPICCGFAPRASAKATRITPPENAPVTLAQAESSTSVRCAAGSSAGSTWSDGARRRRGIGRPAARRAP